MLKINVPGREMFDDARQEFVLMPEAVLVLEHSLASLSKWESAWKKPFLSSVEKTSEEALDYIRKMCVNENENSELFNYLPDEVINCVNAYINDTMTATWFREVNGGKKSSGETVTSEVIYYWMFSLGIPIDCENWHLNRLLTLIRVFNNKNSPKKKMSMREIAERNRQMNAQRRQKLVSRG